MLRFLKVTSENLKIGKLSVTSATWNFQELVWINFTQSQVHLKKNHNSERIYPEKKWVEPSSKVNTESQAGKL